MMNGSSTLKDQPPTTRLDSIVDFPTKISFCRDEVAETPPIMSWQSVTSRRSNHRSSVVSSRRSNKSEHETPRRQTEKEIQQFLQTYKTTVCCKREEHHDWRQCPDYHSINDQRRNPYEFYYSPEDEGSFQNQLEKMYHPSIFQTSLCRSGKKCPFGTFCAHAHFETHLRNRTEALATYEEVFSPSRAPTRALTLSSAFSEALTSVDQTTSDYEVRDLWAQMHLRPKEKFLPLPPHLWFVVRMSEEIFRQLKEVASVEGLGIIQRSTRSDSEGCYQGGLVITGLHVEDIEVRVRNVLDSPSPHFATQQKHYGERIVSKLMEDGRHQLSRSTNLFIESLDGEQLRLTAVTCYGTRLIEATSLIRNVIEKVEYWVDQEGYNDFHECGCCVSKRNADEGILCANGHFFCSVGQSENEQCFARLTKSQFLNLHTREDYCLVCPECDEPYEKRAVAASLPNCVFEELEKTIVDAKVTKHTNEMNSMFDERVHSRVKEVLTKYGNSDASIQIDAKRHAKEARDTILNLRCPHCKSVYFDFSGCMAIVCNQCKGNFCAYCHSKTETSRGAHEHVRQCLMNETANGNYHANPDQIRNAQRRYRTREIKKFLRAFKKDLQNAIVIELEKDLADLGIKQEALFELGYLLDD